MISGKEIKVLDSNAEFYGVPNQVLMENAGRSIAEFIENRFKSNIKEILFICGLGNNGGDGFVGARYLSKKYNVSVLLTGKENEIKTDVSNKNFKKLKKENVKINYWKSKEQLDKLISKSEIIIDSMLGIGLSGSLREPYLTIVNMMNKSKGKTIISVDIATGFGTDSQIKPHYTITFHDVKYGMNTQNSGEITKVDIGVPLKAIEYIGPGELKIYYPRPKKESHKGENGRVLVIGGGPYIGAPALTGLAALRTGADLVYIFSPKRVAQAVISYSPYIIKPKKLAGKIATLSPNLIVNELNDDHKLVLDDIKEIENIIPKVDACAIGPGLGSDNKTIETIDKLIRIFVKNKKFLVIDADAIKVAGKDPKILKNSKTIVTPHSGEFKELTKVKLKDDIKSQKIEVEKAAKKLGITILLKGSIDVISNGTQTKLNDIHNSSMTVGGTGDVLAGLCVSLLSKGVEPFNAARIAAFINGSAGNIAFDQKSFGLIATDIIENIPTVLKKYL
jgi:NAD(P)H-hydrate epimerase